MSESTTTPRVAVVDRGRVSTVLVATLDGAQALQRVGMYPGAQLVDVGDLPDVAGGWAYDGTAFTAPEPVEVAPTPTPTDPGDTPTPTTPDTPGGSSAAEIAELRATTVAQQESIDWLTDVVTMLVTGGEDTGA